jgi:hypothetical protein
MEIKIKTDFVGQMAKSAILKSIPRAFKTNATTWAADTKHYILNSYKGGKVFKRPPKEIDQNLDAKVFVTGPEQATIVIGTGGYVGKNEVVYADIQERGGTIRPKGHPFLAIPMPGVKNPPRSYTNSFLAVSAGGQYMIAQTTGKTNKGFKVLFLLRRQVTLPARRWFSTPIAERRPELDRTMLPASVWATAQAMSNQYVGMGG